MPIRSKEVVEEVEIDPDVLALLREITDADNKIIVPDQLVRPHKLIRDSRQLLRSSKPDKYGALMGRWNKDCLNIRVSKRSLDRALLFLDTLFKSLEKLSFEISIFRDRDRDIRTDAKFHGLRLEISLSERSLRFEQPLTKEQQKESGRYEKYRFEPSGEFELILRRRPLDERHWRDTGKRRIEDRLNDIVAEFVLSTELVRIETENRNAERLRNIELELAAEEKRQKQLIEPQRREILENQPSQWRLALDLRQFLDACEHEFRIRGHYLTPVSQNAQWLVWAREHAERIDPVTNISRQLHSAHVID